MATYKLVQKKHPMKPAEAPKWYATGNSAQQLSGRAMVKAATANTTTGAAEMQAALDLLSEFIPKQLRQGHSLNIPGMGTFRLSFNSEGVDDIGDFHAESMIRNPRVIFTPCQELKEAVRQGLTFENNGVIENKITYASLKEYRRAKGESPEQPQE